MFDLTASAAQQDLVAAVAELGPELQDLGATSELDRTPPDTLVTQILDRRFPVPMVEGAPDGVGLVLAAEELGHADPGVALTIVADWQSRVLLGEPTATLGLVAPLLYEGFGRAPSEFRTTATAGAEGWVVTGRKESVVHPGAADGSVVVARAGAGGELAIFRIVGVPTGYAVARDDQQEGKLGLRAARSGAVRLDRVALAAGSRVEGAAIEVHRRVNLARLLVAAIALGTARASVDHAVAWVKERHAFGKPIASYQGVSFVLVDLASAIETARLAVLDAATSVSDELDPAAIEASVGRALARATTIATEAGRQGVNLLGVHGIVTDHPVERWYRSAAALSAIDFDPLAVALEVA